MAAFVEQVEIVGLQGDIERVSVHFVVPKTGVVDPLEAIVTYHHVRGSVPLKDPCPTRGRQCGPVGDRDRPCRRQERHQRRAVVVDRQPEQIGRRVFPTRYETFDPVGVA